MICVLVGHKIKQHFLLELMILMPCLKLLALIVMIIYNQYAN